MIVGTCSNVGGWVLTLSMNLGGAFETLIGSDSAVVETLAVSVTVPVGVAMAETLGGLVDAVAEVDRTLAKVSAWRAELIDQARRCSELNEQATSTEHIHCVSRPSAASRHPSSGFSNCLSSLLLKLRCCGVR